MTTDGIWSMMSELSGTCTLNNYAIALDNIEVEKRYVGRKLVTEGYEDIFAYYVRFDIISDEAKLLLYDLEEDSINLDVLSYCGRILSRFSRGEITSKNEDLSRWCVLFKSCTKTILQEDGYE